MRGLRSIILCSLFVAACGGGGSGGDGGPDGGPDLPDAGGGDLSDAAERGGNIYLSSGNTDFGAGLAPSYFVSAGFYPEQLGGAPCARRDEGACQVYVCPPSPPVDAGVAPAPVEAGLITITGGNLPVMLMPQPGGNYLAAGGSELLWDGGETLTVQAAGSTVPAFSQTIVGPGQPTVTSPPFPTAGAPFVATLGSPIDVVWTGGNGGELAVFFVSEPGDGYISVGCRFPAEAGQGTVPAGALADFSAGETGFISISASALEPINVGGWAISINASSGALNPANGPWYDDVLFQ